MEDANTALTQFTCNKHSPGTRERVHMCMCQQGASACTHLCFGGSQLLCQLRGMTLGGTSQLVQHHLVLGNHIGQRVVHALPTPQDSTRHPTPQQTTPTPHHTHTTPHAERVQKRGRQTRPKSRATHRLSQHTKRAQCHNQGQRPRQERQGEICTVQPKHAQRYTGNKHRI